MQGQLYFFSCEREFSFLFQLKEERDLIFRYALHFIASRNLYLNQWSVDFNLVEEIETTCMGLPSASPFKILGQVPS